MTFDFIQNIQQIEVYKGSNDRTLFSAIAGAVNFITDIDYVNVFNKWV